MKKQYVVFGGGKFGGSIAVTLQELGCEIILVDRNPELVQELADQFRQRCGSIICREILKNPPSDPVPSPRTEAYYASRPCVRMVYTAADILDHYIAEHPVEK